MLSEKHQLIQIYNHRLKDTLRKLESMEEKTRLALNRHSSDPESVTWNKADKVYKLLKKLKEMEMYLDWFVLDAKEK